MENVHYIALIGISGCLPNYITYHDTKKAAIEDLLNILDAPPHGAIAKKLRQYGIAPLEGIEYASIERCTCDTPEAHSDSSR